MLMAKCSKTLLAILIFTAIFACLRITFLYSGSPLSHIEKSSNKTSMPTVKHMALTSTETYFATSLKPALQNHIKPSSKKPDLLQSSMNLSHRAYFLREFFRHRIRNLTTTTTTQNIPSKMQLKKYTKELLNANGTKVLNPHPFVYTILEKDTCKNRNELFLLIIVHTAVENQQTRDRIRRTWAAAYVQKELKTAVIFAVGKSHNPFNEQLLRNESLQYHDIIQENFIDAYRNLTYKAVMWLNWTATFCPRAKYVMKIDDDIFMNIFSFADFLQKEHVKMVINGTYKDPKLFCYIIRNVQAIRQHGSKWYVTIDEYPFEKYPNYCDGWAYIMTPSLVLPLYKESFKHKFLWVDDVFITGILPDSLGVKHVDIRNYYSLVKSVPKNILDGSLFFQDIGHHMDERAYFTQWRKLLPRHLINESYAYYNYSEIT